MAEILKRRAIPVVTYEAAKKVLASEMELASRACKTLDACVYEKDIEIQLQEASKEVSAAMCFANYGIEPYSPQSVARYKEEARRRKIREIEKKTKKEHSLPLNIGVWVFIFSILWLFAKVANNDKPEDITFWDCAGSVLGPVFLCIALALGFMTNWRLRSWDMEDWEIVWKMIPFDASCKQRIPPFALDTAVRVKESLSKIESTSKPTMEFSIEVLGCSHKEIDQPNPEGFLVARIGERYYYLENFLNSPSKTENRGHAA